MFRVPPELKEEFLSYLDSKSLHVLVKTNRSFYLELALAFRLAALSEAILIDCNFLLEPFKITLTDTNVESKEQSNKKNRLDILSLYKGTNIQIQQIKTYTDSSKPKIDEQNDWPKEDYNNITKQWNVIFINIMMLKKYLLSHRPYSSKPILFSHEIILEGIDSTSPEQKHNIDNELYNSRALILLNEVKITHKTANLKVVLGNLVHADYINSFKQLLQSIKQDDSVDKAEVICYVMGIVCETGKIDFVHLLLPEMSYCTSNFKFNFLLQAIIKNHYNIVELLLTLSSFLECIDSNFYIFESNSFTAMGAAAYLGNEAIIRLLIAKDVTPLTRSALNAITYHELLWPSEIAERRGHSKLVSLLREYEENHRQQEQGLKLHRSLAFWKPCDVSKSPPILTSSLSLS